MSPHSCATAAPPQVYLRPQNQSAYWLGLQSTNASWPSYSPLDPTFPVTRPTSSSSSSGAGTPAYQAWGLSLPSGKPEPKSKLELCAAANATTTGFPLEDPWSWSTAACTRQLPFACRQQPLGQWSVTVTPSMAAAAAANVSSSRAAVASTGARAAAAAPAAGVGIQVLGVGTKYVLNTSRVTFTAGQAWCNSLGGNLVGYDSAAEQAAVEAYFRWGRSRALLCLCGCRSCTA
jgi:hypothetical protein